jgi:hypothetical protein
MTELTETERESLAQAVVREFIDHAHYNPGVYDRSRCDRIVAPAVAALIDARLVKVEALAAKWRASSRSIRDATGDYEDGVEYLACADDLDAALAAPDPGRDQ